MTGQVNKSEYEARQRQMEQYIFEHSPYEGQSLGVNLHELVDYAKENGIPYNQLSESDIEKFKVE